MGTSDFKTSFVMAAIAIFVNRCLRIYSVWCNLIHIFPMQFDYSFQGELFFISESFCYAVYYLFSPFYGSKIDCTILFDDEVPCSFFINLFEQVRKCLPSILSGPADISDVLQSRITRFFVFPSLLYTYIHRSTFQKIADT